MSVVWAEHIIPAILSFSVVILYCAHFIQPTRYQQSRVSPPLPHLQQHDIVGLVTGRAFLTVALGTAGEGPVQIQAVEAVLSDELDGGLDELGA